MSIKLSTLLVPTHTTEVEYPGFPGFKVKVSFISREILADIRKKSLKSTFKNRALVEELNEDTFLQLYTQKAISGWSGLKLSYLEQIAPVNITGQDPETELEYSEENALHLMKNSSDFDNFVGSVVSDLGKFSKSK